MLGNAGERLATCRVKPHRNLWRTREIDMTAEEWINEFSTQQPQPKTVLHASNVPPAATHAASPVDDSLAEAATNPVRRHPLMAVCIAGLAGFVIARTL